MALDRLEAMRAFCKIVEVGSFKGAAESLGLATTTVSGQVQSLEKLLGIKLLYRSTRKVSPTTEGTAYYTRARAVIDDVDELEASVAMNHRVVRGRVSIEMPSPVGIHLIIPALPKFTARFPDMHLDIGCGERVVDLAQEGVDCAIRGGIVSDQDVVSRKIGQMRFCFCASPAYLTSSAPVNHPSDLLQHRHLGFKFPGTGRRFVPTLTRGDERFTLDHPPAMYFNNGTATAAAAAVGLGVAFLPRAEVNRQFHTGELVEIFSDWSMASMPMSIVYPYNRHLSARVRTIADWVSNLMASDPLWCLPGSGEK
ncbi:LysR family transcriptional regulator [Advenella mimigardefordensis]|uniref:Transcriptional regulator, LysR family n=1 Tax=Advenella mimigardefordensis (strain DSM 17166 / LMG 22922 / DPN7) TaxID=1247726 RepID=W0P5R7_ADVMD|nr:LysR family transcriptional regulator [Advenella mimigardefordensis]AHG62121.1 transcriptional regulator, LysR family [Advenella mimigardefordensis DPN7]